MIFDLQGKRRRLVQAVYLVLAILIGGGLIFFGVGSGSISGGLFDAITGKNSNSSGAANSTINARIKKDQAALTANAQNQAALQDLVRSYYQLATDDADANTGQFGPQGKANLAKADAAWRRYVALTNNPDDSLASLMLQAYGPLGLNKAPEAQKAAEIIAAARPSAQAYLTLTTYAAQAGDTRTAQLAGQKAIQLAPKAQRKLVKQQVAQATASSALGSQGATTTSTTGG
jgi:hypothetical protein